MLLFFDSIIVKTGFAIPNSSKTTSVSSICHHVIETVVHHKYVMLTSVWYRVTDAYIIGSYLSSYQHASWMYFIIFYFVKNGRPVNIIMNPGTVSSRHYEVNIWRAWRGGIRAGEMVVVRIVYYKGILPLPRGGEILFHEIFIKSQWWRQRRSLCVHVVADLASILVVCGCGGGNGLCLPILFWRLVSDKSTNLKTACALPTPLTPFYLLPRSAAASFYRGRSGCHCGHLLRVSTRFSWSHGRKTADRLHN